MFLIASLGAESVYRFLIVLAVVTGLYLIYGMHAAAHHDQLVESFTARYRTTLSCQAISFTPFAIASDFTRSALQIGFSPATVKSCLR